jgi:hypothetical protein
MLLLRAGALARATTIVRRLPHKLVFRDDQQILLRSILLWTHAVTPGALVILGWCEAFVAFDSAAMRERCQQPCIDILN